MFTLDDVAMLLERRTSPAMMLGTCGPMEWLSYRLSPPTSWLPSWSTSSAAVTTAPP
jgi:hypothetical protein